MFGSYRLLLAVLVAVSHLARPNLSFNVGVVAVVHFYLISGFVMTALLQRYYTQASTSGSRSADASSPLSTRSLLHFYADRGMRIYPQYLLFAGATWALHAHYDFLTIFLDQPLDARAILFNLLIIPLDFFMFDETIQGAMLIPPAWSLGAELQFYLVFPFILAFPRTLMPLAGASVVVFGLAMFDVLDSDWYGYRLLPGVLFMFLTGSLLYQARTSKPAAIAAASLYGIIAALAIGVAGVGGFEAEKSAECLTGFLLGVPVVYVLSRLPARGWDDVLGYASYGTFLVHNLVMYVMASEGILVRLVERDAFMAVGISISIGLGFAGYYAVERPVVGLRRRLRAQWAGASTR